MKIFSLLLMLLMFCNATASQVNLPYYQERTLTPVWLEDAPLHVIGGFEATNQLGESAVTAMGEIRVFNFFFTSCPGICTTTMRNLRRVQDSIQGTGGQMISFSITPLIDTPERLQAYATELSVDQHTWQLLTGSEEQVNSLARDSFFALLERNVDEEAFVHTEKAYLVDRQGHIRGVYNATSMADLLRLIEDYELLMGG